MHSNFHYCSLCLLNSLTLSENIFSVEDMKLITKQWDHFYLMLLRNKYFPQLESYNSEEDCLILFYNPVQVSCPIKVLQVNIQVCLWIKLFNLSNFILQSLSAWTMTNSSKKPRCYNLKYKNALLLLIQRKLQFYKN